MSASIPFLDLPGQNRPQNASIHKMPSSMTMNSDEDEGITFDSPQEKAAHYREKYRRILDMLDETRAELDEFQSSSKELEDELENELQATEKQQAELKERIKRLEAEKEDWRAKHVALQKLHSSTTGAMQREMDNLRSERDKTLIALRDLEMGNDELEKNERVAVSSLLDLESKYNRAIEEKTLLEQEVIQRQELEEENQRLKDDIRDANNEIAILRDQLTRAVPTPPSSVSVNMSPVQEPSRELSHLDIPPLSRAEARTPPPQKKMSTPEASLRHSIHLTRSNTLSSIPTLSPAAKRYSARGLDSPLAQSQLARSTTSRNLAQSVAPESPALRRTKTGSRPPSPARNPTNPHMATKTKGFKLLHDLQAKLKATDEKLGTKVPKRLVSGTLPLGIARRTVSSRQPVAKDYDPKVAISRPPTIRKQSTPVDPDKSGATFLSPNGWVMVSDNEDTPTNNIAALSSTEPASPLDANYRSNYTSSGYRSASSASNKPLPTRPGIPSPLASNLSRSTASRTPGPSSRAAGANGHTRTPSRQDSRPMSPGVLAQPTRSYIRSPTPTLQQALSTSVSAASTRPSSRSAHRPLGRGPPPPSKQFPNAQPLAMSVSTSTPSGMRRSGRRSSLGAAEASLPPTGIPAPVRTPGRPMSMSIFDGTPPPVPRIPSAHKRQPSKDVLARSTRG